VTQTTAADENEEPSSRASRQLLSSEAALPRQPSVLRFVLAWAELRRDELRENWRRARAGETLQPIEPLR
jgi:hypothetical protein